MIREIAPRKLEVSTTPDPAGSRVTCTASGRTRADPVPSASEPAKVGRLVPATTAVPCGRDRPDPVGQPDELGDELRRGAHVQLLGRCDLLELTGAA